MSAGLAAVAVDGGDLTLASGLLALVRPALDCLAPGGVLAVLSVAPAARDDLPAWCRVEHHRYLGCESGADGRDRHLLAPGGLATPRPPAQRATALAAQRPLTAAASAAAAPAPPRASTATGFAPRDAAVEPGGPAYPFTLLERAHVAPPEAAGLYDQAVAAQWDGGRDLPWDDATALEPAVEAAVAQVMTFLAENELAALYVPARFLPRLHPAFAEVAMFLATQLADEARHIDVFLKRARLRGGPPSVSSAITSHSLLGLLAPDDFTESTFLLSVLGEGTFLDLLRFIEGHAPDSLTAEIARRTRADEARHVHFGLAHVRHALAHDATCAARLEDAVRRRAAGLHGIGGVPARVQDALTLLAAGATAPRAVARGHEAFRALLDTMHEGRIKRLQHAGFSAEQAETLSELHTPNFM